MNGRKSTNSTDERLKIQEKALSNLVDSMKKREKEFDEDEVNSLITTRA